VPVIPPCTQEEYTGEYPRTLAIDRVDNGKLNNIVYGGITPHNITASLQEIIDDVSWEALKTKMIASSPSSRDFQEMTIDFYNEIVVVVFDSIRPTATGWSINIVALVEYEDRVVIDVSKVQPPPNSVGLSSDCQPYDIVRIPMCYEDRKPIVFE